MASKPNERMVLLNRLVSVSPTKAPQEHKPPIHGAEELLDILERRRKKGLAVEFFYATNSDDEKIRLKNGEGHNFIRLRQTRFEGGPSWKYAVLLIEFVDQALRSFPVVHTKTFTGREIEGDEAERGAVAAHVVIRMPLKGAYDDGSYRCAVEAVHSISRHDIGILLNRQLLREARAEEWVFGATILKKGKKPLTKEYRYRPRLDLLADVGRKLDLGTVTGRKLSYMLFTKRSEKHSIGKPTAVNHTDFYADVDVRISAKQGPNSSAELKKWVAQIRADYEQRGFDSRMYYRYASGGLVAGDVHASIAGAADLLMCPKELILLESEPKRWRPTISNDVADKMKALLDQDELWERVA